MASPFILTLVVAVRRRPGRLPRPRVAGRASRSIDLRVFKIRSYGTGVFLMTTLGFVLYGSLVLLPIMLQTLLGYPSLQAGIAMAPRGLGSLIGMPVVGLLIGRIDARKLVARRAVPAPARSSGSASSISTRATGTSSGRSSCRAWRCRCSSCR